ncbi:GrpE protein homolog, mitochondrial, putative [Plasmodium knowlesi strain H]|uniref:GrpE protein homolog n=3 Tax=Plasmodium knowlesi TaxID=5850 RepID=A0A5K1TWQ5_PLAKH|nr:GrpE protein homolog, mitochondrial, putative [Plasmodium knowlesi strain H]OTN64846.1 GrpE protein-like protein [Plasmodium knowlesi]CAA9988272.1 GrpE protein homolog, mitochondrial, putative [Plasmodium knowlesi strain H]SBO20209.1 GrpE protein homolog, mitochondrial, putative [Plasmodium knowlesi strain H]SBO20409.1 GrpE protein homolog, mitochondrial, putative [Plasmodium knowlesi strain H]VVS77746.1 GrpE protein homolog, mitochondrial, putative [Plasmodium knowlesi strain H]|eukprot:XP_002259249.1 co-chaperone grpe, putative [Plasmodium knowlesi strain H]
MKYAHFFLRRGVSCRSPLNTCAIQRATFRRYYFANVSPNEICGKVVQGRLFTSKAGMSDGGASRGMEEQNGSNGNDGIEGNGKNEGNRKNEGNGEKDQDGQNSQSNQQSKGAEGTEESKEQMKEINYEKLSKADLINEIRKTKRDIEEKMVDNKILKEKYLSVLAENENIRHRYVKEIENSKLYCISNFAKSLLDVADNLSLAIKNINEESLKQNEEISNIYKGIQMTETILHNIFNKYGIDKYDPINEKFNPLFHEALFEINDSTKEKGTVATVVQQGYKIKDRILRAAKVGVVKN